MDIVERFLNYVSFDTQSAEDSQTVPSTAKQLDFAKYLRDELKDEGFDDVEMDDNGYVYATLKSNIKKEVPTIGFISHYDTSPDCSGKDVKPRIVKNYDGKDIELSPGIISSTKKFPELLQHVGEDLIVTDGHTLLGADDKAGIAEIVQAMCWLRDHKEIPHGDIRMGFNPDEEIGMGAHHFDVEKFGCEWAYTMDGGDLGDLEFENFNAASAKINIKGVSVHPGYAKGKMINANRLAAEFAAMLPADETPETTEGYEGFNHLHSIQGTCEETVAEYIIRNHDLQQANKQCQDFKDIAEFLNKKYGYQIVEVTITESYLNMKEALKDHMFIVEQALAAIKENGLDAYCSPIRGGTDGARLTFKGLPCPNLGTGGFNYHGPYEYCSLTMMEKQVQILLHILKNTASK